MLFLQKLKKKNYCHKWTIFQMIQLHQGMGHYEQAVELSHSLLISKDFSLPSALRSYAEILHAHSLVLFVTKDGCGAQEQLERLPQIFELLKRLFEASSNCVLLQKMIAQIMGVLLRFWENNFSSKFIFFH